MGSSTDSRPQLHSHLSYLLRPFANSLFTAPRIPSEGLHPYQMRWGQLAGSGELIREPQVVLLGLRLSTYISAFSALSHGALLSHKEEETTSPGSFW